MNIDTNTKRILTDILDEMLPILNELQKRKLTGVIASSLGHGGVTFVNQVSGISRKTIRKGKSENNNPSAASHNNSSSGDENLGAANASHEERQRKPGGGRKRKEESIPDLKEKILSIIEDNTYGDPMKVLHWTTLSLRDISSCLDKRYGIKVNHCVVSRLLDEMDYSKQQNQKMLQLGKQHPDRDAQFKYINEQTTMFLEAGMPVISIDTKKKENIGNFKNKGKEYRKKKDARKVLDHDFPIKELGSVAPYGIYVINNNTGFVNLGTSHDTPEFAESSVLRWWNCVGKESFPETKKIYIVSDGGGSNGYRIWLWKIYLQELSNTTGLELHVSHLPPGTSKWNKIEHRLFCYISKNWEGKPLIDIETVVNLIGSTTTKTGLKVICKLDNNNYETGKKYTEEQKESLNIEYTGPNKEWNYIIRPNE